MSVIKNVTKIKIAEDEVANGDKDYKDDQEEIDQSKYIKYDEN